MLSSMEPTQRPTFSLAGAGSVLLGFTAAAILIGIGIGWALGETGYGFLIGAIVGLPLGVAMTIRRYGNAL